MKEVLLEKVKSLALENNLNILWIDETHSPDKDWLVAVIATLNPGDEIFKKDYVAPPIRKRLQDVETISLPNELFEGLPKSTRKVKARRLKIMSEAFAEEKATRMKEMRKALDNEILEQEVRLEDIRQRKKARTMEEIKQSEGESVKFPRVSQGMSTFQATGPITPPKRSNGQVNAYTTLDTSASSAKGGKAMEFVKSMYSQVNQKSPNTQKKKLTGALDNTTLNITMNPQNKHKLQLSQLHHCDRVDHRLSVYDVFKQRYH